MTTRLPAEFERHERTIMCWPVRAEIWGSIGHRAEEDYATIAHEISRFEPVTMVATEATARRAAELCGSGIEIEVLAIDDSWARDTGPIYVVDEEADGTRTGRTALDWRFNSWGGKFRPFDDDARLVERWCDRRGEVRRTVDVVLEGGAIATDGQGTLLTTQQCLLHPNRNPDLSRSDIESALRAELAVDRIVWLPLGLALDDDTDGHVDNVAAFAAPRVVLLQGCDDPDRDDHARMELNRRWLEGSLDARGRELEVVVVPVLPFCEVDGEEVAVPYLNLYVCNGGVLVPTCGHPADDDMLGIIADQFPDRAVVAVPGEVLALGGGGPHCITQQVPACE